MTKTELLELISNDKNSEVEFKRDEVRPEELAKEIVALANFRGGHIVLGVEDDGAISGLKRNDPEHWVMDTVFGHYVHPAIIPFYQEIPIGDGTRVAVISITEGNTKPYVVRASSREEIYLRIGSTSRLATREQQARLYQLGGLLHTESLPVSGSGIKDFSLDRLRMHLLSILCDRSLPKDDDDWYDRLCTLGFMVERQTGLPTCTIAGLLLFGHRPRQLIRQAGVRWMAFDGPDKTYRALDDRRIDGPMIALARERATGNLEFVENGIIENLVASMDPFLSEDGSTVNEFFRRERRWHYPPEAVREAVLNAMAHRDWTRYEEIEIVRYADRLEVLSPGALPNSMTIKKMKGGRRSPRNPIVAETLQYYGYVDARGMGVRNKIIPLLAEQNGTEPLFEATDDSLGLTMFRKSTG